MKSMKEILTGRTALVTGASRGIGRAAALALAEAGCDVAINYLHDHVHAQEVVAAIEHLGRKALAVRADVSQEMETAHLVSEVKDAFGAVDVLVNNAGINPAKPLTDLTPTDWNTVIATNLTSAFLVTQAALPGMIERQWGRIIMMSSIAAQTGGVIGPHYAASKAGMIGLAHSYASLLAKQGITSNAIAPALIDTDMIRANARIQPALLPIGRFGTVDEVALVVVLLAQNSYITGQTINLNGGWYMT